ncbi:MAG: hypothetical protein ACOCP8_05050 [archaeon]
MSKKISKFKSYEVLIDSPNLIKDWIKEYHSKNNDINLFQYITGCIILPFILIIIIPFLIILDIINLILELGE